MYILCVIIYIQYKTRKINTEGTIKMDSDQIYEELNGVLELINVIMSYSIIMSKKYQVRLQDVLIEVKDFANELTIAKQNGYY